MVGDWVCLLLLVWSWVWALVCDWSLLLSDEEVVSPTAPPSLVETTVILGRIEPPPPESEPEPARLMT